MKKSTAIVLNDYDLIAIGDICSHVLTTEYNSFKEQVVEKEKSKLIKLKDRFSEEQLRDYDQMSFIHSKLKDHIYYKSLYILNEIKQLKGF